MALRDLDLSHDTGQVIGAGALAGIIAGLVFAAFEMMAGAVMSGWPGFVMPLRMIGAIGLGPAALDPGYSLVTAALVGVLIHMALAIVYGAVFAALVSGRADSTGHAVLLASIYGFALWVINFYLVAPRFFPWFLDSPPLLQFIAHTVFFGSVLGYTLEAFTRGSKGRMVS